MNFEDRTIHLDSREQWLEERAKDYRLTGSAFAGVLGVSPWASPWSVYNEKRLGLTPEVTAAKAAIFARGHKYERRVMEDYTEVTGREVTPADLMLVRHPRVDWVWGSPDGFVEGGGFEAKTSTQPEKWGESGTVIERWGDDAASIVPPYYAIQCYVYMSITELPFWDLAVTIPQVRDFPELRWYRLMRDEKTEEALIKKVGQWRERHLVGGLAPDYDGSDECRAALNEKYRSDSKETREASTDEEALIMAYLEAGAREKAAADDKKRIGNALLGTIREDYGLTVGKSKVIAVRSKGRTSYDVKRLLEEHPELASVVDDYRKDGAGSVSLRTYGFK